MPNRRSIDALPAPMRWLQNPFAALLVELLVVALPLNAAYGFAMDITYRLDAVTGLLFALIAALAACNAYLLYARHIARRDARELGMRRLFDLSRGLGLGALLIATIVAMLALSGNVRIGAGGWPALAGLPGVAVLAGVYEELIARGVVLRNLEAIFGSEIAIALGAALFGCLHGGNPHATTLSTLAIGIEGGVMLGAVYVYTRSLVWTIGVHVAWNFTQTTLFGIADSGHAGQGLLHTDIAGPAWLSGGEFGIEASLVSVVVCTIVAGVFLVRAYRERRIVAPIWERRAT